MVSRLAGGPTDDIPDEIELIAERGLMARRQSSVGAPRFGRGARTYSAKWRSDNGYRVNPLSLDNSSVSPWPGRFSMDDAIVNKLEQRLGRLHTRQRLGIEKDHEAQIFGQGINFFHIENWYSIHSLIRNALKLGGIFWRGQRNADRVQVRHNSIRLLRLPRAFHGFTLLHISDLHVDMNKGAMRYLEHLLPDLAYDICVITGDYRGATFGPFADALEGMKRL